MNFDKHNSSQSTIFLLHGLGGRNEQWRNQIEILKKDHFLIIPDLLGHGGSNKPIANQTENPYNFNELTQDIIEIFNRYQTDTNIVIAHSYGCALALMLALKFPEKITKLILITPVPFVPNFDIPIIYRLPLWLMTFLRPLLEKKFLQLAFDPKDSKVLINRELKAMQQNDMNVIKYMILGMQQIPVLDISKMIIPTLIITGEHDKLILPNLQREFYAKLPNKEFVLIKDGAHLPQLEQPLKVNEAIAAFIQ